MNLVSDGNIKLIAMEATSHNRNILFRRKDVPNSNTIQDGILLL